MKNVGRKAVEAMMEARDEEGPFQTLQDFCDRVDLHRVNKRVLESLIKCGAFDSLGGRRAQLTAVLDRVVDEAQKLQKAGANGQMSIFGGSDSQVQLPDQALPDVPEWSETQRLAYEKESTGFYVTGHPLEGIMDRVSSWKHGDTDTLADFPDKSQVHLVGVKRSFREVTTKGGKRMGFLSLEDLKGTVEVVCFPDIFQAAIQLIEQDQVLCIKGQLEHGDEQCKVLANEVLSVEEVEKLNAPPFHITLSGQRQSDLHDLMQVIKRYPGSRQIRLHLVLEEGQVAVVKPSDEIRVDVSQPFLDEFRSAFDDRVEIRNN